MQSVVYEQVVESCTLYLPLHSRTCLSRLGSMTIWCLVEGNKPTFRGVFKVFSSKVELQLCILLQTQSIGQLYGINIIAIGFFSILCWCHTFSTQEAKKGWFFRFWGMSKANPRSLPLKWNKWKKNITLVYISTKQSQYIDSVNNWVSTIFGEGDLAFF